MRTTNKVAVHRWKSKTKEAQVISLSMCNQVWLAILRNTILLLLCSFHLALHRNFPTDPALPLLYHCFHKHPAFTRVTLSLNKCGICPYVNLSHTYVQSHLFLMYIAVHFWWQTVWSTFWITFVVESTFSINAENVHHHTSVNIPNVLQSRNSVWLKTVGLLKFVWQFFPENWRPNVLC